MKNNINDALQLREEGKLEKSNQLLLELLKNENDDPYLNYQVAWSFDILERESEAVYYYEKSIKDGLDGVDLEGAFLGLGSTYRTLGKYDLAAKTLKSGIEKFPNNNALKVFYSMVLYNLNQFSEGMEILLRLIATTSEDKEIRVYQKAIMYYSDKLDKIWWEEFYWDMYREVSALTKRISIEMTGFLKEINGNLCRKITKNLKKNR